MNRRNAGLGLALRRRKVGNQVVIYFVEFLQFLDSLISVWVLDLIKQSFELGSRYYAHSMFSV